LARNLRRRLALVGQANSRCISTAPRRFLPVSFPEPDTPDGLYWESNATAVLSARAARRARRMSGFRRLLLLSRHSCTRQLWNQPNVFDVNSRQLSGGKSTFSPAHNANEEISTSWRFDQE